MTTILLQASSISLGYSKMNLILLHNIFIYLHLPGHFGKSAHKGLNPNTGVNKL